MAVCSMRAEALAEELKKVSLIGKIRPVLTMKNVAGYCLTLLLGFLCACSVTSAPCDTFATRCKVPLGQVFQDASNRPIKLLNSSQYNVYFEVGLFYVWILFH